MNKPRIHTLFHILAATFTISVLIITAKVSPGGSHVIVAEAAEMQVPPMAAWVWKPVELMSAPEQKSLIAKAKTSGVHTLFIAADRYVTLTRSKDPGTIPLLTEYKAKQSQFLKLAHESGLLVHALGGDTNWATSTGREFPKLLLTYVLQHNLETTPEYRYDGIQFDIEPYSAIDFNERKTAALTEFLDTAQILVAQQVKFNKTHTESELALGFAVPYWLDGSHPDMPYIKRGKRTEPVTQQLMRILNRAPGNYLAVMAYRDFSDKINGTIELVETELLFAKTTTPAVTLYVGQETTEVEPNHITFFEEGRAAFLREAKKINTAFAGRGHYRGIAIHDLESFIALKR